MADESGSKQGGGFSDEVLDDDYYGGRTPGVMGRTGLLLGVLIGAAVAAFGAWVIFYDPQPDTAAKEPLLIQADPDPYKSKPEDPGGQEISNQDILVYDRLSRRTSDEDETVETLITRPEELADLPEPADQPSEEPAETSQESVSEEPEPAPEPVQADSDPEPDFEPVPAPVPEPVETPPASAQQMAGGWTVQLVAMRSEEAALYAWERFQGDQPDLLGDLQPLVVEADLGDRGIFYRLRTGGWADREPADALCAALQNRQVDCRVAAP